jgi:hypothetical protein
VAAQLAAPQEALSSMSKEVSKPIVLFRLQSVIFPLHVVLSSGVVVTSEKMS